MSESVPGQVAGHDIGLTERQRRPAARDPEAVSVRRLASPTDETLDLDEDAVVTGQLDVRAMSDVKLRERLRAVAEAQGVATRDSTRDRCYKCIMRSIGIRELRQHASRYVREAQGGETIEVTDRGRPLALLVPIPETSTFDRLAAAGAITQASGSLEELGPPLPPAEGVPLPSEILAELREHER